MPEDQLTRGRGARQRGRVVRLLGREEAPRLVHIAESAAREDRADDRRYAQIRGKPPSSGDLVGVAPPARRLGLHPMDTGMRAGRNGRLVRAGPGLAVVDAGRAVHAGAVPVRRARGRSPRPGWRSAPGGCRCRSGPGTVRPFARKPTSTERHEAATNAPTIPPAEAIRKEHGEVPHRDSHHHPHHHRHRLAPPVLSALLLALRL